MQPHKVDFGTLEWQSPLPRARFKTGRADEKQIRLVELTSEFAEPWLVQTGRKRRTISWRRGGRPHSIIRTSPER